VKPHTLLLTGQPGVGKTTVIRKIAGAIPDLTVRGFFTEEIRSEGRREGFRLETFDGDVTVLSHVDIRSPHRLGRYGVDVAALDRVVDSALRLSDTVDLYLIDEIGKMECFSERFVAAMKELLDSPHRIVATIHRTAGGFIGSVRRRSDAEIWELTLKSRDGVLDRALSWIRR
jgi:nucleoside-triphosphatase